MNKAAENDELLRRVKEAASRPMTSEEWRAQRVSFIISAVGRDDDSTRKEVEEYVNDRYGNEHG